MSVILSFDITDEDIAITSTSSKGNQPKWRKENKYIKADGLGYEGLAECIASRFALHTNINKFMPVTAYFPCKINCRSSDGSEYIGVYSENFLNKDENLITVRKLLRNSGFDDSSKEYIELSTAEKIKSVVGTVVGATEFEKFPQYLTALLEFDSIVYNEDRHFANIALIEQNGAYRGTPLFDNGAGLFSDCKYDFPLSKNFQGCRKAVSAKPFAKDFHKQVKACRELYGTQLRIEGENTTITTDGYEGIYSREQIARATNALAKGIEEWRVQTK